MKMKLLNPRILFIAIITGLIFSSCSKDDKQDEIIGTWATESTTFTAMIGTKTLTEYFMEDMGLTADEAEVYVNFINQALLQTFTGTIQVKSDHTYTANLGGTADTGTWSLNSDRTQLTIDSSTDDPMTYDVLELTSSKLHLQIQGEVSEDLNEDGTPEIISIEADIIFTK